jgi:hypothetical protein
MVNLDTIDDFNDIDSFSERRSKPRISCFYPAIVRSRANGGRRYQSSAFLTNMSACGMYLQITRRLSPGTPLFIVVRLSSFLPAHITAPQIAASGTVIRTELLPDGNFGVGLLLKLHRFL